MSFAGEDFDDACRNIEYIVKEKIARGKKWIRMLNAKPTDPEEQGTKGR